MKKDNHYYKEYIKTHLGNIHKDVSGDYQIMDRYYQKNYGKFMPKNKKDLILDIGCGLGDFLYFLKKSGYKNYIGVDISEECITFCRKQKLGNIKNLVCADIKIYLSRTKKQFSVIVMNDVIEHLEKGEIVPILKIIRKKLVKNGKLIIKTPNSANPIMGSSSRYSDFTHTIGFTEESLLQVLKLAGFQKINIFPQDIFVFHPLINFIGKTLQKFFSSVFRLLFLVYGRKTTKIFTKDIIAVAEK